MMDESFSKTIKKYMLIAFILCVIEVIMIVFYNWRGG